MKFEQEVFDKTGTWISKPTICGEAKTMGLNRKMGRIATQRSHIAWANFMVQVESTSADTFIWVDETGSDKRNALRRYAYSLQAVTPINYCLYTSGKGIPAISAISTRGVEDVYLAEGGVNGDTVYDFVGKCLLPDLMPFNGSNPSVPSL